MQYSDDLAAIVQRSGSQMQLHAVVPARTLKGALSVAPPCYAHGVTVKADGPLTLYINSRLTPTVTISLNDGLPETTCIEDWICRPANKGVEEEYSVRSVYVSNESGRAVNLEMLISLSC